MYFSSENTVSACARSRSRMTGCGSVDVGERRVDDLLADAARDRLGADAGEPFGERRPRRRFLTERQRTDEDGQHVCSGTWTKRTGAMPRDSGMAGAGDRGLVCRGRRARRASGRFISSTSGISATNRMPSSWKMPTNDTIVACRCTMPNSAA